MQVQGSSLPGETSTPQSHLTRGLLQNQENKMCEDMSRRVLVTGGAGFIGSHTCLVLLEAGYDLLILDNFSNSSPEALTRVASLADVPLNGQRLQIQQGDIRDPHTLDQLFSDAAASDRPFDAVIHFAGLKAVGESVQKPLLYWDVNVSGSQKLLAATVSYTHLRAHET